MRTTGNLHIESVVLGRISFTSSPRTGRWSAGWCTRSRSNGLWPRTRLACYKRRCPVCCPLVSSFIATTSYSLFVSMV